MIVKVDLEKPYDRINWGFLAEVLWFFGFKDNLQCLIMNIIPSMVLSVCWHEEKLAGFTSSLGLCQGTLSPYLFVLCMEVLHHRITKALRDCQ